ncbi:methyltransferase domain-containing protein [Pseudoduganella sp. OTU4001]|uniref:methyltransferase domain-containing protein n=1 Tax=Pseudoduganella sp. OTU4001 TaxID=3043854 RepID=UPI00313D4D9D
MHAHSIPIITVSYNSPDLIEALLRTLRQFYPNPVYVIDGSRPDVAEQIRPITAQYQNVTFIPFGYNIHHGPGLAWAIRHLPLSGPVLFLDSDVEIVANGFLESMLAQLEPHLYGVGGIQQVNEQGYDEPDTGPVAYLHPACLLANIEVMRQWPMPIKHGAPLIQTMLALHRTGNAHLLRHLDWVKNDFSRTPTRIFIKHDWQGTVIRTGGYHYDLPSAGSELNKYLLHFTPRTAGRLVEVGCGDGTFAKAYRTINPICNYTAIERDARLADLARPHCDFVYAEDVELASADFRSHTDGADCWILGDVLGALQDPWALLRHIHATMAPGGQLIISVRNFQHWRMQARLSLGDLHYAQPGNNAALSRDDRYVFTRGSILAMLAQCGFRIAGGSPLIPDEPEREHFLPAIRALAAAGGHTGDQAVQDALPTQYILVAEVA